MALEKTIKGYVKQAWLAQNPKPLTEADLRLATDLGVKSAERVYQIRTAQEISWQEAWSQIAPEVLATPRASAKA